uniref:DUF4729 domain-containing protein n=1 Tax=Timema shepardi TaxID=629360 RepID=A0A7R9AZW1_TIMSH|nr:unnamed protein product [Timema shepardi]
MASLVLTDSSQLTSDRLKKLPDQIMYPYVEPYDLQKHNDAAQQGHSTMYNSGDCEAVNQGSSPPCKSQLCGDIGSTSRRPVMCPCEGCNKNIAISGLISHFSFEHVDLPMLAVEEEDKSHFWVSPEALPLNITRCIALLLLVDSLDTRGGSLCTQHANDSRLKSGFPILVMGARLTTGPQGAAALLWAADVDSRLRYTAEATDFSTRSLSVSYSGRTESLRANQAPPAILERGLCTVVQPAMIRELAKASGGFDLTIQIHK